MSSPAPALRDELTAALGSTSAHYWDTLSSYLSGKISRVEFDELVREAVDTPHLVQLHNSLIISVLGSSLHHTPLTPPPDAPGKPPRKRRRTLPYPGAEADGDAAALRSSRLKRWTVGMGRRERERVKAFEAASAVGSRHGRKSVVDEIARERGVELVPEGNDSPGTYLPVHLASVTRAPTLQHISERVALISAQHNLGPPTKTVASLMVTACEMKLKQLISQALTLTSTSHAITSIQLANASALPTTRLLTTSSFETLLTVRPAVLPYQSAAATRLIAEGASDTRPFFDHEVHFKERHTEDPRWQLLAMLAERSTVREALLTGR
ncbi:transcriptional regulator of RNA polII, SAGA, subunit-domain-containing protein [Phellopilus nigrolimitatus]|nr:transcriptional regulator of RNA polII, SAGA, subunit-domain-containing protein [Phellopilus nigrolimitatus]